MKKFIGVFVTVIVGILAVLSALSALISLPEFLAFFSGRISWLNASLGYREEVLLGVGVLAVAAWAFDMEIGKDKPGKLAVGSTFLCALAAFALLVSSFDRLDDDSWEGIGVSDNQALAAPLKNDGAAQNGSPDDSAQDTPALDQTGGSAPSAGSSEFDGAFKDESGSSSGCTCSSPGSLGAPPPPPRGGEVAGQAGGAGEVEENWAQEEAAEEAEEASEEAEWERDEAEFEAEMGGF